MADAAVAGDDTTAGRIAATYDHDVEITSLTGATQQVFAQPDGQRRAVFSTEPQRVRRGDGWVPVDLSLTSSAAGLSAAAAPVPVVFSSGGGSLLATVRPGTAGTVRETWPAGTLPTPAVEGSRATYPEVYPGVDLVLTATVSGFAEVLVVKSAVAAQNPALSAIRFGVSSSDAVSAPVAGGRNFSGAAGSPGVRIGAAKWWDSRFGDASASGAGGPGEARVTPSQISASSIQLDAAAVAGQAGVTFPVYVDPSYSFDGHVQAWTYVDTTSPGTSNWMGGSGNDGYAHVGFIDAAHNGTSIKARAFWQLDTHGIVGKKVSSAEFDVKEAWASSCTAKPVELWTTTGISSATTWNNPPSFSTKMATVNAAYNWSSSGIGGPSSCARTSPVAFDATYAAQAAASRHFNAVTFGMKATDETDWQSWKKFTGAATLSVTYNSVPNVPTALRTSSSTPCVTGSGRPTVADLTPTLYAAASDPDKGNVIVQFEWWTTGGSRIGYTSTTSKASGSSTFAATVPSGAFASNSNLSWHARTFDGSLYSGFSQWCELHLDSTAPLRPGVTSAANDLPSYKYFADQGIDPPTPPKHAGDLGSVTISNGGSSDVRQYHYSVNGRPTVIATPSTVGGSVTVSFHAGLPASWIDVYTTDGANNKSGITSYAFPLQTSDTLVSAWSMSATDPGDGKVHSDSRAGTDYPLALREDSAITAGDTNSGPSIDFDQHEGFLLRTDGVNDVAQATVANADPTAPAVNAPVLDTGQSFAVVARVKADNTNRGTYQTFASQWGSIDSAYYFQYTPTGSVRFGITDGDRTARGSSLATAAPADILTSCGWQSSDPTNSDTYWDPAGWHTWIGIYDDADQRVQLWVDDCDHPVDEVATPFASWQATGPATVGSAWGGSSDASNMFAGGMSQLLMFRGVPTPDEISTQLEAPNA